MTYNHPSRIVALYNFANETKAEIDRLSATLKETTGLLVQEVNQVAGKHTVSDGDATVSFTVSENNRYDQDAMVAALKPGQLSRVQVRKVDNALVKGLYPDVHKAAKVFGGYKVTL